MKFLAVVLLFALNVLVCAKPQEYTKKYDNMDIDRIINNDRMLRSYVNCLLGKGKCTKEGAELKSILPDAIRTNCSKCGEAQKKLAKKVAKHLIEKKRTWWNELEVRFDPEGRYRQKYEAELRNEGFTA